MFIVLAVNRRSKPIRKHLIVGRVPYSIYIVEYAPFGWCVVIFYAIGTGKNELSIVRLRVTCTASSSELVQWQCTVTISKYGAANRHAFNIEKALNLQ